MVAGTGPDGRIRAQDVENFVPQAAAAPAPATAAPPAPAPGTTYIDIPVTNMRKAS